MITFNFQLKSSIFVAEMSERTYIAIDLKSFYASVECVEMGLDPLTTNLVVADKSRTEKTICLAVSPSLKAYGIGGRARLFEVVQRVKEVNEKRQLAASGYRLRGKSVNDLELKKNASLGIDYITAVPRMGLYLEYSNRVYEVYLKYIAPEDIHVYSVDEVFIDATAYLGTYKMTAHELAMTMIRDVLKTTGITATAGIGTNLYLAKVAMDIVAKHIPADKDGVRIAELDEMSYRCQLWAHTPLTDFWRVGRGIVNRLNQIGIYTMGDVARCSLERESVLYKMFGVNAELLIDHAWGWEPCTIEAVKAYRPETNSLSNGQVLSEPYTFEKAKVIVKEMADAMSLKLVRHRLVTDQIVLTVNYDKSSLSGDAEYDGDMVRDYYGRLVPKHAHGTKSLNSHTSSTDVIMGAVSDLYDEIVNPDFLVRRVNITVNHVIRETDKRLAAKPVQLDLFSEAQDGNDAISETGKRLKERRVQEAVLNIKHRYGKNAILRGLNFEEGATAIERNKQIGGHRR